MQFRTSTGGRDSRGRMTCRTAAGGRDSGKTSRCWARAGTSLKTIDPARVGRGTCWVLLTNCGCGWTVKLEVLDVLIMEMVSGVE